jgi:hypothetical protein
MRDVPRASSPRQRLKQNTAGDVVTQVRKTVYQNRTVYSACCLNFVVNPVVRSWLQLKKFDMLSLVSSYSLHYLYFICPSSHALYCWDPDRLSEHLSPVEFRSFWLPLPRSFSFQWVRYFVRTFHCPKVQKHALQFSMGVWIFVLNVDCKCTLHQSKLQIRTI